MYGQNQTAILLYHRVIPKDKKETIFSLPEIVVYEDSFEKQMKFLSENYHVISLDDFIKTRGEKIPLPRKTAVITFDDGWEDNYLNAFPILKKYKMPATIFLTTCFIGTREIFWQEKVVFLTKQLLSMADTLKKCLISIGNELQQLFDSLRNERENNNAWLRLLENLTSMDTNKRESLIMNMDTHLNHPKLPHTENSFLNWEQIHEMEKHQIDFASHGATHRILTTLKEAEIKEELESSMEFLQHKLNTIIKAFAYPNGNYNNKIINLLEKAGYSIALTVESGTNTNKTIIYCLKRINVCEDRFSNLKGNFSKELFAAYLAGIL